MPASRGLAEKRRAEESESESARRSQHFRAMLYEHKTKERAPTSQQ